MHIILKQEQFRLQLTWGSSLLWTGPGRQHGHWTHVIRLVIQGQSLLLMDVDLVDAQHFNTCGTYKIQVRGHHKIKEKEH